jgi:predicted CoA-binding protein
MSELSSDNDLKRIYDGASTIAVVGAHPDSEKPAHYVPAYLRDEGYRVIPINPGYVGRELWGEQIHGNLSELEETVDVVDFFRRSQALPDHVDEILAMEPKPGVVWLQQGIRNDEFAQKLIEAGIDVVQDRCMYANHKRLYEQ